MNSSLPPEVRALEGNGVGAGWGGVVKLLVGLELRRGCTALVVDSASGFKFYSLHLPSPLHNMKRQKRRRRPPRLSGKGTMGCEGSHQVPDSRWSRVTEFHLLVMSM